MSGWGNIYILFPPLDCPVSSSLCLIASFSVCVLSVFYIFYSKICCSFELEHLPLQNCHQHLRNTFTFHRSSKCGCTMPFKRNPSAVQHFRSSCALHCNGGSWKEKLKRFLESAAPAGNILGSFSCCVFCCLKCPDLLAWLDLSSLMHLLSCHHLGGMIWTANRKKTV